LGILREDLKMNVQLEMSGITDEAKRKIREEEEKLEKQLELLRSNLNIPMYKYHENIGSFNPESDAYAVTYDQSLSDQTFVENDNYVPNSRSGKDPETKRKAISTRDITGPIDLDEVLAARRAAKGGLTKEGSTKGGLTKEGSTKGGSTKKSEEVNYSPFDCPECAQHLYWEQVRDGLPKQLRCGKHAYLYCLEHDVLISFEDAEMRSPAYRADYGHREPTDCMCRK